MEMTRVTANEFQQAFGELGDKARQEPVVITTHGRDSLVVMAAEEWERLRRRDRKVGSAGDLPTEWIEAVQNAAVPDTFAHLDAEDEWSPASCPSQFLDWSYATAIFGVTNTEKGGKKDKRIVPAPSLPQFGSTVTATPGCWSCPSPIRLRRNPVSQSNFPEK